MPCRAGRTSRLRNESAPERAPHLDIAAPDLHAQGVRSVRTPPDHHTEDVVKDNQLKALIRKTSGKAAQKKPQLRPTFDPTLEATRGEEDRAGEAKELFKEMKRREF